MVDPDRAASLLPPARAADGTMTSTRLVLCLALILAFNGMLAAWVLFRPAGASNVAAVDNVLSCLGPLCMVPLCFGLPSWLRPARAAAIRAVDSPLERARRRVPILLGLGILCDSIAVAIWAYYEQVLHQALPFPSADDIAYLSVDVFLFAAILCLPSRRLSPTALARTIFDVIMIMLAVATFSWYFILGPTMLQDAESFLGKAVGTAYPVSDLVLMLSLLLVSAQSTHASLRLPSLLLVAGFGLYIAADSVFDYQTLQGTYATGEIIDVGWPLADMLIALAAYAIRTMPAQPGDGGLAAAEAGSESPLTARAVWRALLPYAFVPFVGLLLWSVIHQHAVPELESGVYVGAGLLIAVILLRQVAALMENRRLYRQLHATFGRLDEAYKQAEVNNAALAAANIRLRALATTDPLTGIANHRAMVQAIDAEVERSQRFGHPCALLFIDVDHFKMLNDTHGHSAGDATLQAIAAILRTIMRAVDIPGRWGGEEFVVVLPETDGVAAAETAERLRSAIARHDFPQAAGTRCTCSIGVAVYPDAGAGRNALIDSADQAMYRAKRLGRNRVCVAGEHAPWAGATRMGSHM